MEGGSTKCCGSVQNNKRQQRRYCLCCSLLLVGFLFGRGFAVSTTVPFFEERRHTLVFAFAIMLAPIAVHHVTAPTPRSAPKNKAQAAKDQEEQEERYQ